MERIGNGIAVAIEILFAEETETPAFQHLLVPPNVLATTIHTLKKSENIAIPQVHIVVILALLR